MTNYVTIGNATLYHGDCREIIGSLTFDAILTDPPYGLGAITRKPFEGRGRWENAFRTKTKNLHAGGTWAAKEIYKDIGWDNETPDVTFLLQHNVPTMIFGGNYFTNLYHEKIKWDKVNMANSIKDGRTRRQEYENNWRKLA